MLNIWHTNAFFVCFRWILSSSRMHWFSCCHQISSHNQVKRRRCRDQVRALAIILSLFSIELDRDVSWSEKVMCENRSANLLSQPFISTQTPSLKCSPKATKLAVSVCTATDNETIFEMLHNLLCVEHLLGLLISYNVFVGFFLSCVSIYLK